MKKLTLILALALPGCGETYNSFGDCYTQHTGNRANEDVIHVEHCDGAMSITHASAEACASDHAADEIRADVLASHCQSIR